MTEKNWRFKVLCVYMRAEVDVSAHDMTGGSERTTCILLRVDSEK